MDNYLIKNACLVNENRRFNADVLIKNEKIEKIAPHISVKENITEINADGKILIPGIIDDQVHFREPGNGKVATIQSESRAAIAGGVTSYMDMPNNNPPILSADKLDEKYAIAAHSSMANYSFYMGTSNDNYKEVMKINARKKDVCGIKIFMGSSTGNMLVDKEETLEKFFADCELPVATHCESESRIKANMQYLSGLKELSIEDHPNIRDAEACYESSSKAVSLARKFGTRLHVLHLTTEKELSLFRNDLPVKNKQITVEVCIPHLHFSKEDYQTKGSLIKCNPAIKDKKDKDSLWQALLNDTIDNIATDHAPHDISEKGNIYQQAKSGMPMVQHSLSLMLYYESIKKITLEKIVKKMCHAVADSFSIEGRGYLKEGYWADLILIDPHKPWTLTPDTLLYKCGWSPIEGFNFPATITHTFVNGHLVYHNGVLSDQIKSRRLTFSRS